MRIIVHKLIGPQPCLVFIGFFAARVASIETSSYDCALSDRTERTAPSKTKDRMSSVSLLMGVKSNSGTADARAAVTWPSTEVAARLSPLPNCSFYVPELRLANLRTG